jgi:hypothetical protein
MSFDSTKDDLVELLKQVKKGELQLPEFQRDYVWSEDAVISLIASIAKGYPVGALLTLKRGGDVDFKPRGIEGTKFTDAEPEELLLDGQQRMTSLFQALYADTPANILTTKNKREKRYFFLNIEKALSSAYAFEEAVETVPESKKRMTNFNRTLDLDVSTPELQYEQHLFPLNHVFDERDWLRNWRDYCKAKSVDVSDLDRDFYEKILKGIQRYEMPIIRLGKDNGREAVCTIFEKVNVGGVKLDAFELVTAIYAGTGKSGFDLRHDWWGDDKTHGRVGRIKEDTKSAGGVFDKLASTDFLQACTLLHTVERRALEEQAGKKGLELPPVSCKREELLRLPLDAYQRHADAIENGFREAAKFVGEQRIVYDAELPYFPQLVALAALFALSGTKADNAAWRAGLSRWYWAGVLGEHYGSGTDTKIARDIPELKAWLEDGAAEPQMFKQVYFQADRLYSLRSRRAAAFKGFHALMMRHGCRDFVSGKPFDIMTLWQETVDVHHIFPQSWCKAQKLDWQVYDSIINKTPLSAVTNRYIVRGDAPSVYLKRIEDDHNIEPQMLDEILRSHLIDPALLRADDFEGFIADRRDRLANLAAEAMGKKVEAQLKDDEGIDVSETLSLDERAELEEQL